MPFLLNYPHFPRWPLDPLAGALLTLLYPYA